MRQPSRQQISRQIIGRQFYLKQKKKQAPVRLIHRPGKAFKFEFIMSQDTSDSIDSVKLVAN